MKYTSASRNIYKR